MGYMHIDNLYKNQDVLLFKECYALEKIHGTSAHVSWGQEKGVAFFSGGAPHERFVALFDKERLERIFAEEVGASSVVVYGEAYGGKTQGMSATYGKELRFVAFDVRIAERWLSVPKAEDVCVKLGFQFVDYVRIPTDEDAINYERDRDSTQAKRNGVEGSHMREGVVLRPLIEVIKNNETRIIAKHKRAEFSERKSIQVVDPAKRKLMEKAEEIADEWVTPMRLEHVLDKMGELDGMKSVPDVIKAMIEDVTREAEGEIVDNKAVRKAIGARAVAFFKKRIMSGPFYQPKEAGDEVENLQERLKAMDVEKV
jgi:hypothetical protein